MRNINIVNKIKNKIFLTKEEKIFIKLNSKKWKKQKKINTNQGYILIENCLKVPIFMILAARIAKILENEEGVVPAILSYNIYNKHIKFFNSFNIEKVFKIKTLIFDYSIFKLINFFRIKKNLDEIKIGEELLEFRYKEVEIGDLVYDAIIRSSNGSILTIDKIEKDYQEYIKRALFFFEKYDNILKEKQFKYLITSHKEYIEYGILTRVALSKGITVIHPRDSTVKVYRSIEDSKKHYFFPEDNKIEKFEYSEKNIDKYINSRFNGEIKQHDVINAFKGKKYLSKEEWIKSFKLDTTKKNVFIMPHAFSDAPHCSSYMTHKDYYDWYKDTIEEISKLDNANWLIKSHPSSKMYREEGIAKDIFDNNKKDGMYFLPEEISTACLKEIADVIITIQGTAGLEFSCLGIPTIICGEAFYSKKGFTIECKTKEEYHDKLKNISKIEKLNEQQIVKAKKIMNYFINYMVADDFIPINRMIPGKNYFESYAVELNEIISKLDMIQDVSYERKVIEELINKGK